MHRTRPGDRDTAFSRLAAKLGRRRDARRGRWRRRLGAWRARRRLVGSLLLVLYLATLADLTLFRFYQVNPGYNLVPGRTILHDLGVGGIEFLINTVGNVVATLPLGVLLPIVLPRRVASAARVAAATFGTSLLIELAQAHLGRRVADVDDLILNTLGGWLGYGLGVAFRRRADQKA